MVKKVIILTGFEKFGSYSSNLSRNIVIDFNDKFREYFIERLILPVSWKRSKKEYINLLKSNEGNPSLVVLLGIHSKKRISLEKLSLH